MTSQFTPTAQQWADRLRTLKRTGNGAFNGPCPLCGGRDRFHVKDGPDRALVGCRGCLDGQHDGARFGELMRAVWGDGPRTAPQMARVNPKANPEPERSDTVAYVRRLWGEARPIPIDGQHPARRWFVARHLWRHEIPAPDVLRWLPAAAGRTLLRAVDGEHGGRRPAALDGPLRGLWTVTASPAAGALVAALAPIEGWLTAWQAPPSPRALHLVAVTVDGAKPYPPTEGKDKRPFGYTAGAVLVIGCPVFDAPFPFGPVHVAEGLADALALSVRYDGPAVCTAGTAGMQNPTPALAAMLAAWPNGCRIVADDDSGPGKVANHGLRAANALARAVDAAGGRSTVVHARNGKDYADRAACGLSPLPDSWKDEGATLRAMYPLLPRWEIGRRATIA